MQYHTHTFPTATVEEIAEGLRDDVAVSPLGLAEWSAAPGGITDGDKGDIVVSASGTVWTFDGASITAAARTLLDDATTADMLTTLGAAAAAHTHSYASLTGIPSTFAPSSHSHPQSEVTNLVSDLALKAPLASPALTGTPTSPTATPGTNTTQIASTAFVTAAVAAGGGGGGVSDGDKGDIVVSASGATWMLDSAVVTAAAKTVLDDTTTGAMLTTLGALPAASYTAADVLSKLLTVDGAASGLDADLLDGQSSAFYQSASNLNAGTLPAARFDDTAHGSRAGGSLHADVVAAGASGFMTGADKTKLNGVATGATANSSDATLLARANHTGTQLASTISDFSTAADARITAASLAPLASPALTGTPTAPTAGATTNTTQIATTAFVKSNLAVKVTVASSAPGSPATNDVWIDTT